MISTLWVAAGVAIDNARLYEASQRQQRWLKANAEITEILLSGSSRPAVLELIALRRQPSDASFQAAAWRLAVARSTPSVSKMTARSSFMSRAPRDGR